MGAANVLIERRRTPSRRATLLRMAEIYAERFADADGRIRATFDIIWLSGWAPHASQQQPLKPGSAKASLAEAVKKARRDVILMSRHGRGVVPAIHVVGSPPRSSDARDKPGHDAESVASVSHQQINQMRDQRNVRGRHRVVAQLVGADPGQGLAFARRRPCPSQRRQM